jgi:hypothetical protein
MSGSNQFRVAGTAYIRVDGRQYALRGNMIASTDMWERDGVAGQDGVHGFIETARVPFIEADLSDIGGLSVEQIRNFTNVTVQAELANGKKYLLRNAWSGPAMELNTAEGQVTVRWQGMRGEELMT